MSSYMTHWWHIVHEAVDEADRRCDGNVPWRPAYADVFPDPEALRRALAHYWQLHTAGAEGDGHQQPPGRPPHEHRGLLMVLTDEPRCDTASSRRSGLQWRRMRWTPWDE
jgi:hypothetical protein